MKSFLWSSSCLRWFKKGSCHLLFSGQQSLFPTESSHYYLHNSQSFSLKYDTFFHFLMTFHNESCSKLDTLWVLRKEKQLTVLPGACHVHTDQWNKHINYCVIFNEKSGGSGSIPAESGNFLRGDWSWNILYGISLPFCWFKKGCCQFLT